MSAKYSFLPYLRQGLSSLIVSPYDQALSTERAAVNVEIGLAKTPQNGGPDVPATIAKSIQLKGPGDITGINSAAIAKVSPTDWVTNFEPNYLPYIEFYDEDFPWRYTPGKETIDANDATVARLQPWLALVALEEEEFTDEPFTGGLYSIRITDEPATVFGEPEHLWAWAHVHVNEELIPTTISPTAGVTQLQTKLIDNPDKAVSRILCPRKLKPNTGYHVFLIPSYKIGRLAGLGIPFTVGQGGIVNALEPAWTSTVPAPDRVFPVYHRWFFKTGAGGDFESLVRLLRPRVLSNDVGKREIDLQLPGNTLVDDTADPKTIGLEGVLRPTSQTSDTWPASGQNDFTDGLKTLLNEPQNAILNGNPDPVIAPPIYGRWHAQVSKLEDAIDENWVHEANLDPRLRVFAGAGAEVVRQNQEQYMNIAWQQVGQVIEANHKIRQMQVALQASTTLHTRHLDSLDDASLINISGPVHNRIQSSAATPPAPQTVYKSIGLSPMPNSMVSGAFRRISRPASSLMRSLNRNVTVPVTSGSLIQSIATNAVVIAPAVQVPPGQSTLTIIQTSNLNSTYLSNYSTNSNYTIMTPGAFPGPPASGPNSSQAQNFVAAASNLFNIIASMPGYVYNVPNPLNLLDTGSRIITETKPDNTVPELAGKLIKFDPAGTVNQTQSLGALNTVLAAPKIVQPMYEPLAKLGPDWMLPGLNSIAQNSINLLETNSKYMEAYMLGLNHEMARELLWREYPTDQRGTCFHFFWDYRQSKVGSHPLFGALASNQYRDIKPIHEWRNGTTLTDLGANGARQTDNLLVLTIRGELLRKYPGAIVYMQKAEYAPHPTIPNEFDYQKERHPVEPVTPTVIRYPAFSAQIEPDIYFLGFENVTAEEAKGGVNDHLNSGWFFVFQERAGELRFGADISSNPQSSQDQSIDKWNDLTWDNILASPDTDEFIDPSLTIHVTVSNPDDVQWNRNSADTAYGLLQAPVKLYVHAKELIP